MAKLYFRYGAMNSGKSTALLQAAFNYEERGQRVLLAKPAIDTKGAECISSRLGMVREVDFLIGPDDRPRAQFLAGIGASPDGVRPDSAQHASCLLVDEAQFCSAAQIDELFQIAVLRRSAAAAARRCSTVASSQ